MRQTAFDGELFVSPDKWQSGFETELNGLDQIVRQPADVGDRFMTNSSFFTKRPAHERRDVQFAFVILLDLGDVHRGWPGFVHATRCSKSESLRLGENPNISGYIAATALPLRQATHTPNLLLPFQVLGLVPEQATILRVGKERLEIPFEDSVWNGVSTSQDVTQKRISSESSTYQKAADKSSSATHKSCSKTNRRTWAKDQATQQAHRREQSTAHDVGG